MITYAEIQAKAAELGPLLSVPGSHVDDPRPLAIGDVVSRRVDPLATHPALTGRVVARWHNGDGEPGVELLAVAGRGGVKTHRLLIAELVTDPQFVHPATLVACDAAARGIYAAVGAGKSSLSAQERRWLCWAEALLHAGRANAGIDPYPLP